MSRLGLLMMFLSLCCAAPARAAAGCGDDCVAVGQWQASLSFGLGYREQVVHGVSDTPLVLLPSWSYYGRRFFINNLELGYSLWESPSQSVSVVALPGYEQMFFNRYDPLNFLDAGGTASGAGSSSGIAFAPRSYRVEVEVQPPPTPNMGGNGGADGGVGEPAAPALPLTDAYSFGGVTELWINGQPLRLDGDAGSDHAVPVGVKVRADGGIVLSGLGADDQIEVRGAAAPAELPANIEFNAVTPELDGASADRPGRDSIARRRAALLTGLDYQWQAGWYSGQLQLLGDASDTHGGYELRLAASRQWRLLTQEIRFTLGANYQTRRVLDYYYGLHPRDNAASEYAFRVASGGISAMARLDWQRPITDHWTLQGLIQYRRFADEIVPSPLLEKHHSSALFVGVRYSF